MKKILILLICFLFLVGGFFLFNSYIYNRKQGDPTKHIGPYRGSLMGTFVCLPHTDSTPLQTLECAYGIKTDTGEYYVLDLSPISNSPPAIAQGDHFVANGNITPIEYISSNQWQKYPVVGIFSVTDSVKKI